MKNCPALLTILSIAVARSSMAQPDVESATSETAKAQLRGSWVGELSPDEATLAIVYHFKDDRYGELEGFFDSPDQGAIGLRIANIAVDDDTLSFDVPMIGARYSARLNAENMEGTFTQLNQAFPLNMTRGRYLQRLLELSQEAIDRLEGSWVGGVQDPVDGPITVVLRFEASAEGQVAAFLDSPDQGESDVPVSAATLEGETLSLEIPFAQVNFLATLSNNEMAGVWKWTQGNNTRTAIMVRGEYTPIAAAANLSDEAYERLAGTWSGTWVDGTGIRSSFIIRFEATRDGTRVAFFDIPAQGFTDFSISEVVLEGDGLTLNIPGVGESGATMTATLAGDQMEGLWHQSSMSTPVTLVRERSALSGR